MKREGYDLLRKLGEGSFGEVWLAKAPTSVCVAKIVYRHKCGPEKYAREFNSLRRRAKLSHTDGSLISINHVQQHDDLGFFYYTMPKADDAHGTGNLDPENYEPLTLEYKAQRRLLPADEAAKIGLQLLRAVEFLDTHDLTHGDIKPANIVYINGCPVLADIGLLKRTTMDGTDEGSSGYVCEGEGGTLRGDLYALAKTLYLIFSGNSPKGEVRPGHEAPSEISLRFRRVLTIACDKDANRRYVNIKAFRLALDKTLNPPSESVPQAIKPSLLDRVRGRDNKLKAPDHYFTRHIDSLIVDFQHTCISDSKPQIDYLTADELECLTEKVGTEFERRVGHLPQEFHEIRKNILNLQNEPTNNRHAGILDGIIKRVKDIFKKSPAEQSRDVVDSIRQASCVAFLRLQNEYREQFIL